MLTLLLLLVAGSLLAYVSQDNLMLVSVNVGPYMLSDIPLFYVIIGSFTAGIVLAYVMSLLPALSASLTINSKKKEIKKKKDEVLELTKRVHQLELENEKLKHGSVVEPEDANAI